MTTIKMNVSIEVETSSCTELGYNGKDVVIHKASASLLGQQIASVDYHEGFKSEKAAIRELKLRIKNNLN